MLCCIGCGYCGMVQKDTEVYYDEDEPKNFYEDNRRSGINGSETNERIDSSTPLEAADAEVEMIRT